MLFSWSHECVGGEVHWWWRCSGAHRRQAGRYEQQSRPLSRLHISVCERAANYFVSLFVFNNKVCRAKVAPFRRWWRWRALQDEGLERKRNTTRMKMDSLMSRTTSKLSEQTTLKVSEITVIFEYLLHVVSLEHRLPGAFCSSSLSVCIFIEHLLSKIMRGCHLVNTFLRYSQLKWIQSETTAILSWEFLFLLLLQ